MFGTPLCAARCERGPENRQGRRGLRPTGAIAREWKAPLGERVVSMPVLTALMIAWRPSIFSCGESLLFSASALAVYGSSSLFVDMVMLFDDGGRRGETPPSEVCIYACMRWETLEGGLGEL